MRHLVLLSTAAAIAVYVSGHGFGHAVRTGRVVRALQAARPDLAIHVKSVAPARLFPASGVHLEAERIDVGIVQPDALTPDLDGTLSALDELERRHEEIVSREARWISSIGALAVLADIPAAAFDAARAAGVPAFALGNFSWDWIYRSYGDRRPGFGRHADRAARAYASARALFRLPFHGDLGAFGRIEDVPLIAERSPLGRAEARRRLGLPTDRPVVLLSFGGIGLRDLAAEPLAALGGILFVATEDVSSPPPNFRRVDDETLDYTLLLRASDAVVTKPGYGITASSLVNGVRVLYTSRGEFPEYPVLVEALETHGTAAFVPPEELRRGALGPSLEALLARPVREAGWSGAGDETVAARLLAEIGS